MNEKIVHIILQKHSTKSVQFSVKKLCCKFLPLQLIEMSCLNGHTEHMRAWSSLSSIEGHCKDCHKLKSSGSVTDLMWCTLKMSALSDSVTMLAQLTTTPLFSLVQTPSEIPACVLKRQ